MDGSGVITVQVGQAGNQVGAAMLSELAETYETHRSSLFRASPTPSSPPIARAVLIDMEPKVVAAALSTASASGRFAYDPSSAVCRQSGSANNWAYGFHVHGDEVLSGVMEAVR